MVWTHMVNDDDNVCGKCEKHFSTQTHKRSKNLGKKHWVERENKRISLYNHDL